MRRFSNIDNQFMMEHKLSLPEVYVLEWMLNLPIWAERVIVNKKTYYFASKTKAVEDLPMVTTKPDTMYRYYKKLESVGLIENHKIQKRDFILLTDLCSTWNQIRKSDGNPDQLGNSSENHSDFNPTYSNINTINSKKEDRTLFSENEIEDLPKQVIRILNESKPTSRPFEFTASNLNFVKARANEGFKLDDFKKVISFKVAQWKNDQKMKKYIRPSTLFGPKFNQYLVEASDKNPNGSDGDGNFEFSPTQKASLL